MYYNNANEQYGAQDYASSNNNNLYSNYNQIYQQSNYDQNYNIQNINYSESNNINKPNDSF